MRPPTLLGARTPALVALSALLAMLGVHIVLRTKDDLSPWKGAGFAMFSTADSPGMRSVVVWAEVAGSRSVSASPGVGRRQQGIARPADPRPDDGPGPQRGGVDARATCRWEPGRGDHLARADAGTQQMVHRRRRPGSWASQPRPAKPSSRSTASGWT